MFLEQNQRVFVYEDNLWAVKGRYDAAVADNEDGIANTRFVKKTDSTINKCGPNISPYSLRLSPLGLSLVSILNSKLPYRNMPSVSIKFLNL